MYYIGLVDVTVHSLYQVKNIEDIKNNVGFNHWTKCLDPKMHSTKVHSNAYVMICTNKNDYYNQVKSFIKTFN